MVQYLLEKGVDPNKLPPAGLWAVTPLCKTYMDLMRIQAREEDEVRRNEFLEAAKNTRDLLLAYGAICDSSLDQRQQFIKDFSSFWSKLNGNVVYAYVQDDGQLILQGTDTLTKLDISEDLRQLRGLCEEWVLAHQEVEDLHIAIISLYDEDEKALFRLQWALRDHDIKYAWFRDGLKIMRCDIPALIEVFKTHTLEEIKEDWYLKLFESVCPDQGEIRSMFSPEKEAELNAL